MQVYIYKTINLINNKIYIGQSSKEMDHNYLGSGRLIKYAIKKYGRQNFKKEILFEGEIKQSELDEKEKEFIKTFNSADLSIGYNIKIGGNNKGIQSDTTKQKIREKRLGTKHKPESILKMSNLKKGELNSFYGKKHSKESLAKMEKSLFKKGHTNENVDYTKRRGTGNAMYGKSVYDIWVEKYGKEVADEKWSNKYKNIKGRIPWNKGIKQNDYNDK